MAAQRTGRVVGIDAAAAGAHQKRGQGVALGQLNGASQGRRNGPGAGFGDQRRGHELGNEAAAGAAFDDEV